MIMGPSGCGKSTTIRCINRLTEPMRVRFCLDSRSVLNLDGEELRSFRRSAGFVFQQFNLIARLSVLENVMFHLVLAGVPRCRPKREQQALAKVGLNGMEA